mmetsp:Transcript_19532/g.27838  ORF Transcript_19532/g.27838 Transcript_19532/m.27838 type:complete len:521 (+) Transcript_19532:69-1631(+)
MAASSNKIRSRRIQEMALRNSHREEKTKLERILTQVVHNVQRQKIQLGERHIPKNLVVDEVQSYLDQNPSFYKYGESLLKKSREALDSIGKQILERYLLKIQTAKGDTMQNEEQNQSQLQENQLQQFVRSEIRDDANSRSQESEENQLKRIIETANPWALLQAYSCVETKELIKAEKEKAFQSKKRMSEVLHEQTRECRKKEMQQELENKKYVELQIKELQGWKENMKLLEAKERNKAQQLRRVCDEDLEKKKKLELEEVELSRQMEHAQIERCQKELQKEEQELLLKKEEVRQRFERTKQLKADRLAELERRRKEEEAMDMKHMVDMKRRLDEDEIKRERAFKERILRYEEFAKQMEKNDEVLARREFERKMEETILREAREKELRDASREMSDLAELKLKKIACVETNKTMAEEIRKRDLLAQEADKVLSLQICSESEAYLRQQELAKIKERERKKQNCILLQNQIKENNKSKQQNGLHSMTSVEKSINRKLLDQIYNDVRLQTQVTDILCKQRPEPC